jgi:hypothetical protein
LCGLGTFCIAPGKGCQTTKKTDSGETDKRHPGTFYQKRVIFRAALYVPYEEEKEQDGDRHAKHITRITAVPRLIK